MKKLTLAFLLAASVQLINADNVLKNSDFADGTLSWQGDGRTPDDFKPLDGSDATTNYGTQGLIIPLRSHTWTKIVQDFRTDSSSVTLHITYKLSSDATFSTLDDDYVNVPHSIDFDAWAPFNGKKGGWMTMVSDFTKARIFYNNVMPKPGSTDEQTVTETINSLIPEDDKTICLAFPPGTGAVILLHVSLDTK